MKLFSLFAVVILPLTCIAAKKNSENRFEAYHSKSLYSSPLKLDDAAYEHLASAPRDYTVAVLLTALEARYGCQMCRDFHPEWELIAKSWMKGDRRGSNKVLYGTLDFADGKGTFQKVRPDKSLLLPVLINGEHVIMILTLRVLAYAPNGTDSSPFPAYYRAWCQSGRPAAPL